MSYQGGLVYKPDDLVADVARALGVTVSSQTPADLASLCKHTNINKWAWYKPVRVNKIGVVTETERQNVHYGLSPYVNSYILAMLRSDISHSDIATEFANAKTYNQEWTYNKPRGGSYNEQYRLTDFVESPYSGQGRGTNGAPTNWGYFASTPAPIVFGSDWEVSIQSLTNVASNVIVDTGTSTSTGSWYAKPYANSGSGYIGSGNAAKGSFCYSGLQYQDYKARFGSASNQNLNYNDSSVIPLNYLLSSGNITGENWRLGLVVKVNGISGNNVIPNTTADVFFSQYPLSSISSDIAGNVLKFSIDMCTNQTHAYRMLTYVSAKGTTTFECIPVIAKLNISSIQGGGTNARTYQAINGTNATFYSLPTAVNNFTLKVVVGTDPAPTGNASKTVGNWTINSIFTGTYTGNSSTPSTQRYPINNIVVYWSGSGTPSSSTTYNIVTSFGWQIYDGQLKTGTQSDSVEYGGNSTVTINGTTYYGRILRGGPNLTMPSAANISLSVSTS